MNKISSLLIVFFMALSLTGYAQLSDRVNSPSTFKVGTRPLQGNMGLYFGLAYNEIEYWFENDIEYTGLPIVSLKYYVTDNFVGRIGFQVSRKSEIAKGLVDPLVDGSLLTERNNVDITSKFVLTPGIEYHFNSSNILDVYVGGLVAIGVSSEEFVDDSKYETGEYMLYKRTKSSINTGYEVFAGLQAFIADLPLAVGFDFGLAGMGHLKNKYKHESKLLVGGITSDQLYYTTDKDDPMNIRYRDLTSQDFKLQGNIRVTLTYFFNL